MKVYSSEYESPKKNLTSAFLTNIDAHFPYGSSIIPLGNTMIYG